LKKTISLTGKILLALLIPLLLTGASLVVPPGHAARTPAGALVANTLASGATNVYTGNGAFKAYAYNPNETLSSAGPKTVFVVYVDVINVTQLFAYQVGFRFNQTVLQLINATGPGQFVGSGGVVTEPASDYYLYKASAVDTNASDATVSSNATGIVPFQGWSLKSTTVGYAENGSGLLLKAYFCINPTFLSKKSVTAASMMNFSITELDIQTILLWTDGKTKITPTQSNVHSGYFTCPNIVPEFPSTFSSILLTIVLLMATLAAALFSIRKRSRKREGPNRDTQG